MSNETISSADPAEDQPSLPPAASPDDEDAAGGESPAADTRGFHDLSLSDEVLRALDEMGYAEPMDVQLAVYDQLRAGRDLMVQARTGTGKTAAFGIPIVEMIDDATKGAQVLILAPTRELGLQVARELGNISQYRRIQVVPIYGGAPMKPQIQALEEGAQIIAGTPGRVLDHLRRKTLDPKAIRFLVLDECDEMLSMGFQEEIENIISFLPKKEERQTLLFSATIPSEIERIAKRHMKEPEQISLSTGGVSVDEIDHYYYVVSGVGRTRDLLHVIQVEEPESAIIFCNTREDTSTVAKFLARHGYNAEAISSDLSQRDRERVMKKAREKKIRFLCATDVAARGIDIEELTHVINYTFPESPEVYVHRTGRTGRAGKSGVAVSLVGPREIGSFYYLKLIYKIRPQERELPSAEEIQSMQETERYRQVADLIDEEPSDEYRSLAKRVWQSSEGERIVGALLQRLFKQQRKSGDADKQRARRSERKERDESKGRDESKERDESESSGEGRERRRSRSRDRDRDEPRNGERKRRRRRRRRGGGGDGDGDEGRRSSRSRGRSAAGDAGETTEETADGDAREFWETWADEKTEVDSKKSRGLRGGRGRDKRDDDDADADAEGESEDKSGTVRLYVNIGKREDITADDLRTLLAEGMDEADAAKIGSVALRNTHCYVRVPEEVVEKIIDASSGKSYKEREVVVERARR